MPLREELERVRCYLDIEKFRYEDRLEYRLTVDPELADIPVPPMIIQPLVENAIIHGLDNREEGTVRITQTSRAHRRHNKSVLKAPACRLSLG
ncbi:hypothetical protein [Paenibacillus stellifer]|uniref:sensor histidine kinase n=1 Tax=Paenibacillus stellifer TaxID=169760 RepID=UPI00316AD57E